jgi:hypothetical protein
LPSRKETYVYIRFNDRKKSGSRIKSGSRTWLVKFISTATWLVSFIIAESWLVSSHPIPQCWTLRNQFRPRNQFREFRNWVKSEFRPYPFD